MEIHFEFDGDEGFDLEIDDIAKERDVETLRNWYTQTLTLIDYIRDVVEFSKTNGVAEDAWIWRAGKKIAYLKRGSRMVEQRILELGGAVPYPRGDGRTKHIRNLEAKLQRLKDFILSSGLELPGEQAA